MANVLVLESSLQGIADAIRAKNGTQNTYKPDQMAEAIEEISGGGITPSGTITITENGTVDVTNYASANVNVPSGGGSSIESGTVVGDGSTKTLTFSISSQPTYFVLHAPNDTFGTDTTWNTICLVYNSADSVFWVNHRYSTSNTQGSTRPVSSNVSYSNGQLSITLQYALRNGITYNWFAW